MNKDIIILALVCMALMGLSSIAYAGDIPESIMLGEQKSLLIGVLSEIDSNSCTVIPKTILMGEVDTNPLIIQRIERYYGTSVKPKVGDVIVIVLKYDNMIDDLWVFKATSDDYRTLKLVSEKYDMVQRYEKYINKGKYQEAQNKINTKLNHEEKKNNSIVTTSEIQSKENERENTTKDNNFRKFNLAPIVLIILIVFIGAAGLYLRKRLH
ncbi:MAG: hypothetical protein N2489_00785 [Clostridia bacterium]|nr:hypothetical protein [Clostridia bacterium]